jgi:hypothetical protein
MIVNFERGRDRSAVRRFDRWRRKAWPCSQALIHLRLCFEIFGGYVPNVILSSKRDDNVRIERGVTLIQTQ